MVRIQTLISESESFVLCAVALSASLSAKFASYVQMQYVENVIAVILKLVLFLLLF